MPHVNVQIQTTSDIHKVTIHPERLRIPNGSRNVVVTWNASGPTTFLPGKDGFDWLSSGAPTVHRVDDHTLRSDPFDNTGTTEVVWRYMLGVERDGVKIKVDPEVDNDPPIGG
ncbi:MAG TPA: hypothetical protein VNI54_13020 [Thermoanaerobaculia bacterium]|nr:hypothetical protein [Thermoanaerobaculia bacterium]